MNNKMKDGCCDVDSSGKEWPKDSEVARFPDITDPIRKALQVAMDKGDRVYKDGIEWTGLSQGTFTGACVQAPTVALHASNLTYSNEEQNRDVFVEIISIAVQLGMEQGRRIMIDKIKEYKFCFKMEQGQEIFDMLLKD